MAHRKSSRGFLSLQVALHVLLVFVQGTEDAEEAYRSGRSLVLENFLPINIPAAPAEAPRGREKRDVEGSGEEERSVFSEISEKSVDGDDADNSTQNAFARIIADGGDKPRSNLTDIEGSGEESAIEASSEEEDKDDASSAPVIADAEDLTTTTEVESSSESEEYDTSTTSEEVSTEEDSATTEMIFDKSEDFTNDASGEATTVGGAAWNESTTKVETTFTESSTFGVEKLATVAPTTPEDESTTTFPKEDTTIESRAIAVETWAIEAVSTTVVVDRATTTPIVVPDTTESAPGSGTEEPVTTTEGSAEGPEAPKETSEKIPLETTQGVPIISAPLPKTPEPVVEEIFKEVKTPMKNLEALPGNILRKENLSLGADPMLIVTNTRVMDSEEGGSSAEPKRLGAYIVIGLILLSFSSLVGYITFRKRLSRKRLDFESSPESNDTEKALLSLSDYKDNSELEENHLKNNEITPIVVKSNSQINRFEKNTNFSSPKNLNTTANEKNIEKDNVLKSTAENLTQVIIEDSPKEVEEDKNAPGMEKLIVKTRVDQDSIPKKPIIVTRTPGGYMPITQDNSSIS